MACPVTGATRMPPMAQVSENEKASMSSSQDSFTKPEVQHTYGIDTPNFLPNFLNDDFNPVGMQKIVQEALLLSAGAAAILLQVAHPGVGAGVNRHSNFAYRVEDRLRTTMTFVYAMAYGTPEEKRAIIRMVHSAHAPVQGEGYSADDAEAQMWVAATLYATGTDMYERIFGKFDEAESERIYEDYAVLACTLRVPPEMWPKTRVDFWRYWDHMIDTLPVTQDAISVKDDLLYNAQVPFWVKINMPAMRIATAEWLPPKMRVAFGFKEHSKLRKAQYNVLYAMVKTTYPLLPTKLRTFPKEYYLKDMRERLKAGGHVIGPGEKVAAAA